ncbi:transketolase [Hyphomicrobium sp.]|uniref:transketolase n=1 Tax=Hyphomicrobium sp. TaxID=82 RepID=UPI001D38143C|nr:transketolase [Hyphomicrobium sp.]MBY0558489.1 transketolase [Hyphomicrobium sp.]
MSRGTATKPQVSPFELNIDDVCINTIRTLSMDAVQKANSGHPGTPMALAPLVYTLWQRFLRFDPDNPGWPNRDRFVLSNGHASMLLYAILHLAGVKERDAKGGRPDGLAVTLEDIKAFRQLDSKCPGHPEYGRTTGVEATTGPLGQGCGMSVGMALAGKWLAKKFNKPGLTIFDYDVFTVCGDGDMMEGVASEAASLAGHLMLGNLCWIYDNNRVTIEGHTDLAFSENVGARFLSYGWNVDRVGDVNDTERLAQALTKFRETPDVPSLIIVDSHIGYGAPHKHDTSAAHGEPLGEEEVRLAKRSYGWPEDATFLVPDGVTKHFETGIGARGKQAWQAWNKILKDFRTKYSELSAEYDLLESMGLPQGWDADLPSFPADAKGLATRASGAKALNAIAAHDPLLIGGAADLAPSTKTNIEGGGDVEANNYSARNLHFGIREHAMGAIVNGLVLSGLRAYGSTFLNFSDYMKAAIRLSALMEVPAIFVFTHDSIGLGEDGPTHQPIEQLLALRGIPGLVTLRPADANETVEAWRVMQLKKHPACLALSRQPLPTFDRKTYASANGVARGAYVMADAKQGTPAVILIGTGSEVSICAEAFEELKRKGVAARLVSMPSWELFEEQDDAYRESVLPRSVKARVSVEAGSVIGWDRYVGPDGARIGMRTFGASAPVKDTMRNFGFTAEAVVAAAKHQLALIEGGAK